MAVFGIPAVSEDDALRAVRAAMDMSGALAELNEHLASRTGVRITVRTGVNTGEVVTSGGQSGGQALAAGETVNIAARLQQHARPGEVLLGPQTFQAVANAVVAEPAGPLRLKGISGWLQAYRLLGLDADSPAVARRFDVTLVNRVGELREMELILDRAVAEPCCHLVTLHGDPGMGKSRLAREYEALAARRGALTGIGRCRAHGEGPSLLALADALRPVATSADWGATEGDDQALAILRSGLLGDGTPGAAPGEAIWAACRLLASVGRNQPVLLILDDLHWAEPVLLDMLTGMAAALARIPVIILCLARSEFLAQYPGWGAGLANARSILLSPLGADDSRTLIHHLSDVQGHDAAALDQIVARAEGNALFIEQLVALLSDGADLAAIPPTIGLLIEARLDLLDAAARATAGIASVVGREFTRAALSAVHEELDGQPVGGAQLGRVLAELERRGLIERPNRAQGDDAVYRFCNGMIAEVAYQGMPKRVRARVHERLAHWYESPGNAGLCGTHLERACANLADLGPLGSRGAELASRGAARLAAAGTWALGRGDLARAGNLLDRALTLCPASDAGRGHITLQLAEVRIGGGQIGEGKRLLSETLHAATRAGDRRVAAHAYLQLAYLGTSRRQIEASLEAARATLPVFAESGDCLGQARAWTRIGQGSQVSGWHAEAIRALQGALSHAVAADAELERATALGALAVSYWLGPTPVRSAIASCRALAVEHAEGRRAVQAALNCPLAVLLAMSLAWDPARELIAIASRITDELGHAFAAATVPIFGAAIETLAGDLAAAESMLRTATARITGLGDAQLRTTAARDLARVLAWQQDFAGAVELAQPMLADATTPAAAAELSGIVARALAADGQADHARQLAAAAVAAAERTDSTSCQAMAYLDTASVLEALGEAAAARSAAGQARRLFRRKGHQPGMRWAAQLARAGR
jgi:hypothetical protein